MCVCVRVRVCVIVALFQVFDINNDGTISPDEAAALNRAFTGRTGRLPKHNLAEMITRGDDNNDELQLREFLDCFASEDAEELEELAAEMKPVHGDPMEVLCLEIGDFVEVWAYNIQQWLPGKVIARESTGTVTVEYHDHARGEAGHDVRTLTTFCSTS